MSKKLKIAIAVLVAFCVIISCFAGCGKKAGNKSGGTETAIDILGTIHSDGKFEKRPWYTYEAEKENFNGKESGEYSPA